MTINIGNAATATVTVGDIDFTIAAPAVSGNIAYTVGGAIATTTEITAGNTKTLVVTFSATPTGSWPGTGQVVNIQLDIEYKEPINAIAMYPAVGSFTLT